MIGRLTDFCATPQISNTQTQPMPAEFLFRIAFRCPMNFNFAELEKRAKGPYSITEIIRDLSLRPIA
jgi:hypothetical protein